MPASEIALIRPQIEGPAPSSLMQSQRASLTKRPALATASVGNLVGHVRHITHDERVGSAAAHGLAVADHVVHGDREGCVVAELDHSQRITDKDHVHARAFLVLGCQVIVAGQVDDLLIVGYHLVEIKDALFHF
jgi:hypothetical protein